MTYVLKFCSVQVVLMEDGLSSFSANSSFSVISFKANRPNNLGYSTSGAEASRYSSTADGLLSSGYGVTTSFTSGS
jgi:hypothetical protein